MKIAYLFKYNFNLGELSVLKKIISQINALRDNNIEITLFIISEEIGIKEFAFNNKIIRDEIYKYIKNNINFEPQNIIIRIFKIRYLIKEIIKKLKLFKPNVIYLRDCGFQLNLHKKLSEIAPLFVEIQTKFLDELSLHKNIKYYCEKILKRKYLYYANGLICITNEIGEYESKFNNKPFFVLGNGIDNDEIYFIEKRNNNNLINLLFIGSPNLPWHGIDRLIHSFINAPNKHKFFLHIIGYDNIGISDNNIKCYGYIKDRNYIDDIFKKCDIGIGTLALFRNNMNQAATLKVREYLAKGLPVAIGYYDVDLNNEIFVFNIPNDNSDINFLELENFYSKIGKNYRENYNGLNTTIYAMENLNWTKKMKNVIEFINKNINNKES
ncbi:hypothetical protein ACAG39_07240 [Caldicellulosiruptoraceae bacterium PP1]